MCAKQNKLKDFYNNTVVLLENGIRNITIPDELAKEVSILFLQEAKHIESAIAQYKYWARKTDMGEDDPRL